MPGIFAITGGLLAGTLLVGVVLYLALGQDVEMKWDPATEGQIVENRPEE